MIDCHDYRSFRRWHIPSGSFGVVILILSGIVLIPYSSTLYGNNIAAYAAYTRATPATGGPAVNDPNLAVDVVAKGLQIPTSMAFFGTR